MLKDDPERLPAAHGPAILGAFAFVVLSLLAAAYGWRWEYHAAGSVLYRVNRWTGTTEWWEQRTMGTPGWRP